MGVSPSYKKKHIMKYSIATVCVIKGLKFCYNKKKTVLTQNNKININPLASNATIVALAIKNEITYYDITHC